MTNKQYKNSEFNSEIFYAYYSLQQITSPTGNIWHYTNTDGLQGMLGKTPNITLWFTNTDYLNDLSEGKEVERAYQKACSDLLMRKEITREFYELISNVKPLSKRLFLIHQDNDIKFVYSEYQSFVCCFSTEGNSLDLWRYYAKGDTGYSLKMSDVIYTDLANREELRHYVKCFKVLYEEDEKSQAIQEVIKSVYSIYNRYMPIGCDKIKKIKDVIAYYLSHYKLLFKHECFKSESEYRIVVELPAKNETTTIEKYFRTGKTGLIPYIELSVSNTYLQEIKIGPFHDENWKKALEDFKEAKGLNCELSCSDLPVRF